MLPVFARSPPPSLFAVLLATIERPLMVVAGWTGRRYCLVLATTEGSTCWLDRPPPFCLRCYWR